MGSNKSVQMRYYSAQQSMEEKRLLGKRCFGSVALMFVCLYLEWLIYYAGSITRTLCLPHICQED